MPSTPRWCSASATLVSTRFTAAASRTAWKRHPAKCDTVVPAGRSADPEATTTPTAPPEGLAEPEGIDVGRAVVHPAPHVRVDRHPGVLDEDLARAWRGDVDVGDLEVLGRGDAGGGAGRQADLAAADRMSSHRASLVSW